MAKKHILDLNLRELLFGSAQRLRYIERFSNCRKTHRENVAEHQYFTSLFTLVLCHHVGASVNIGIALTRALVHDVEECFTGDIVRPMKYDSVLLKEMIEKVGVRMARQFFTSLTTHTVASDRLFFAWEHSKDDTVEGKIVRFADFMSVLSYVTQEVENGNKDILGNLTQLVAYAKSFQNDEFEFLQPLPDESSKLVNDIIQGGYRRNDQAKGSQVERKVHA